MKFLCLQLAALSATVVQVEAASPIRMQRDFHYPVVEEFPVYWNVPTFMCHKHGINFSQTTQRYGITANHGDLFRGDYVNILYDPGLFPAMLQSVAGKMVERNGGIPQLGNLTKHLDAFRNVVVQLIPESFNGVGIIDFEAWRPVFRQNWNAQNVYKDMSRDLERQKHPQWTPEKIESQAKNNFELTAKVFMETTLNLAKLLRPKGKWGYYAFPYCFNYRKESNMEPACHRDVEVENNRIQWMFDDSTAIFPSLYLSEKLNTEDHRKFVIGRLNEAWRVASRVSTAQVPTVNPYIWYKYYDSPNFLNEMDMYNALETSRKYRMGGAVIWGATNDVITKEKCLVLLNYLNNTLGPIVSRVRRHNVMKLRPQEPHPPQQPQHPAQQLGGDNIEFVPLVLTPQKNGSSLYYSVSAPNGTKLNYQYKMVRPQRSTSTSTSATPRLERYYKWYERVMKAVFSF